jgi:hypothetical protein
MKLRLPSTIQCVALGMCVTTDSMLRADVFEVRDGGVITGKLLNAPSSSVFKIQTTDGGIIEIDSGKVKPPVIVQPDVVKIYQTLKDKEDTVELHRAVSFELNPNYRYLAIAHRERVVELEPSDENWSALGGYVKDDSKTGDWIRGEIKWKRKGFIKADAGWDTPQSQAIAKSIQNRKTTEAKAKQTFLRALGNLNKDGTLGVAARDYFSKLQDPWVIPVLKDQLKKDRGRTEMYMEILAKMPGTSANGVFLELAMDASNPLLAGRAIELLERTPESREMAFQYFHGLLGSKTPATVDRAGSNLQSFADKRAIPRLIENLVSEEIIKITTPGTQSFDKSTGNVVQSGGGTTITPRITKHQSVLSVLVGLADGVNFQFNRDEWAIWYANSFAKSNLNLRRDE